MLKDRESFAILLSDAEADLIVIVQNISLRKLIKYNRVKLKDDIEYSYVLYTEPQDKQYIFDMARNKKLKLVWKDDTDFYIVDFRNPKGDIIVSYTMEGRGDNATITFKFQKKPKANQKKIEKGRGPVSKDSISSVKLVMKDDLSLGELFSDDVIEELATFALREFQGNSYASVKAMMALGRAKESYDKMINKGTEIKHPRNYFETILQSKCDELQDEEEKEANA